MANLMDVCGMILVFFNSVLFFFIICLHIYLSIRLEVKASKIMKKHQADYRLFCKEVEEEMKISNYLDS